MVYKVVEFMGTPRMKLSDEVAKITTPGSKASVRAYDKDNNPMFDVLCLQSEYESYCDMKPSGPISFTRKSQGEEIKVENVSHFKGLTYILWD